MRASIVGGDSSHYGDVWFRGHFTATGAETGVTLDGSGGHYGTYAAWLNGRYLGSQTSSASSDSTGPTTYTFPAGSLKPGTDNVVSLLLENMGHDEDGLSNDSHKAPRGFTQAALHGSSAPISWRVQGAVGGQQNVENVNDPTRGPFNNGGLYGERMGWYLPGFDDSSWTPLTLPDRWQPRGVPPGVGWYRTGFDLNLPAGTDAPIGLRIADDTFGKPGAAHYKALIYLNGWLVGRYWNNLGPQTRFYLSAGILNPNGHNQVAIASWGLDQSGGGLGAVNLEAYGAYAGGVPVGLVSSPGVGGAGGAGSGPTATPEPGSGVLYGTGLTALLAGLLAWRRYRERV